MFPRQVRTTAAAPSERTGIEPAPSGRRLQRGSRRAYRRGHSRCPSPDTLSLWPETQPGLIWGQTLGKEMEDVKAQTDSDGTRHSTWCGSNKTPLLSEEESKTFPLDSPPPRRPGRTGTLTGWDGLMESVWLNSHSSASKTGCCVAIWPRQRPAGQ